ncbi:3-hydroxyacyl-CoA dehydrogenase [Stackebrandtia albiflava]|uniref:3-hydroxyacyl-CoA dehydrogenase n=1 Tax=Stackebrandtia albiflava TaxID=406432 RepID=UPI001FCE9C10|nr:3-hydroxyacyl-CoA dehydrogenase [Stackebrandtia albiflava]
MIETVSVVGLGTMGAGIAEVFARSGATVIGVEVNDVALDNGKRNLTRSLDRQVDRGRLDTVQRNQIMARVDFTTDFARIARADLVVEAVPERLPVKRELFTRLDAVCPPETILATNTSSLSVTEIAGFTGRPDRVIGMHFFNPAPVMRLVEVITTAQSDSKVVEEVEELAAGLGKTTVTVGDRPGFIVNRLLLGYLNQAAKLVDGGTATAAEIDVAIRTTGLPMGPLTLLDVIGLDTCVEILDVIHADSGSPRHEAADILRSLVDRGRLGRKSGGGFYEPGERPEADVDPQRTAALVGELIPPHVAEGQAMADSGYATITDIDTAMRLGCGYPDGLSALLRE